jgi:uncharacterized membrane protein YsdA (DUF1294 family)
MIKNVYFLIPIIYSIINAAAFVLYGMDKFKAKKNNWRISEQSLLAVSLFGPIGAWLGMQHFRHKTQKPIFKYLVPLFIGAHILFVFWAGF